MFENFDYLDEKYPFRYDKNQKTYEILKNTKNLVKCSKSYLNFSQKYFNMTTKTTYKIPEIKNYPIIKNSEMTALTRQSFDFQSSKNLNFNLNATNDINYYTTQNETKNIIDIDTLSSIKHFEVNLHVLILFINRKKDNRV